MKQSRRAFVVVLVGIGSGCVGTRQSSPTTTESDTDGDGVPDRADRYPNDSRRAFRDHSREGTYTLRPGQFSATALTNSPEASGEVLHYDVEVEGDTEVDCLVFEREAYDAYAAGARDVPIVSEYSRTGVTKTTLTRTLDKGEYLFSLDYTSQVTAPSEQSVTVNLYLELAEPADQ
ncbi:hypothetical protein [Natrinema longum]|uniref:Lipoprotein n=1 Tax=Natrinema longum TaxID=370324 RepID=A0A8A2UCW3_9EURY|nr:hypothetical protein [Natrinema longum]MBZ6496372.1 hypothetical protein [Natrinema longum]QSW85718.1 hypothetical protein J0X27_02425 [Natrinema longum]